MVVLGSYLGPKIPKLHDSYVYIYSTIGYEYSEINNYTTTKAALLFLFVFTKVHDDYSQAEELYN